MENLGRITLFLIVLVAAVLMSLFSASVIISIATLYGIKFILDMSFLQVFGLSVIINIAQYKYKDEKSDEDFTELMKSSANKLVNSVLYLLITWGMAFLMFNILS
jgi:hypothetical protein